MMVVSMSPFGQVRYIPRAFAFLHLASWSKMAGDRADDTKRLLRQCASSLLSACHRLERGETESTAPSLQTSTNVINPPPYLDRPVASSSHTAIQEHMNLFGFNPSSSSQKASTKAVKRKRPGYGNKVPYYQIRNTWTHVFVCLSSTEADRIPDAAEKIMLAVAGLGEKKIEFDKGGDSNHVHKRLIENFSKLGNGGGYEILRSTDRKGRLSVIPMASGGYSVAYLQGLLSQAKAYIRPMQRNLALDQEPGEKVRELIKFEHVSSHFNLTSKS